MMYSIGYLSDPFPEYIQDDRARANKQKEELDRAIALSLAENLKRPQGNLFAYLYSVFSKLCGQNH